MDPTILKIIEEVVKEYGLDPGFLFRVIKLEEEMSHLSRRHGIFEELRDLSRAAAQRELVTKTEAANEA